MKSPVLALAAFALAAPAFAQDQDIFRGENSAFATTGSAAKIAAGDLDNDGDLDFVYDAAGGFETMLGDGAGNFAVHGTYPDFFGANKPVLGRINADAFPDVYMQLVTEFGSTTLRYGLSDGQGGIGAMTAAPDLGFLLASPRFVDLNGDNLDELVGADPDNGRFVVLPNTGGAFGTPAFFATADDCRFVALGDVDDDGDTDVAAVNPDSFSATVLINAGGGSFGNPATLTFSGRPSLTAIFDADDDGDGDLFTLMPATGQAALHIRNANGTYTHATTITGLSTVTTDIQVHDIDGDGDDDLALPNFGGEFLTLLHFQGGAHAVSSASTVSSYDGAVFGELDGFPGLDFAVASNTRILVGHGDEHGYGIPRYPVGNTAGDLGLGDLDGDSDLDVAVYDSGIGNIYALYNDGDGNLSPVDVAGPTFRPERIHPAQLDGDGDVDLVALGRQAERLYLFFNDGDGGFADIRMVDCGALGADLCVRDFDGDGRDDIAVATTQLSTAPGTVRIFLNDGAGAFAPPVVYPGGRDCIACGDFDDDDDVDIATSSNLSNAAVYFANDGEGAFAAPASFPAGTSPAHIVAADFTGDGIPDIAAAPSGTAQLSVVRNNGNATFQAPQTVATAGSVAGIVPLRADGDADIDIAVFRTSSTAIQIFLNDGGGTFVAGTSATSPTEPAVMTAADMNKDGVDDILALHQFNANLRVMLGSVDGTFASASSYPFLTGSGRGIAVADLNGDTVPDVAGTRSQPYAMGVAPGTGTGGAVGTPTPWRKGFESGQLDVGDLNGDGIADIVGTSTDGVGIVLSLGGGAYAEPTFHSAVAGAAAVVLDRFDANDSLDIAVQSQAAGKFSVLLNDGDGTFGDANDFDGTVAMRGFATGPLDGNGPADIVYAVRDANQYGVLLNDGSGGFGAPATFASDRNLVESLALANLDADGFLDLVLETRATLYTGNGDGTFASGVGLLPGGFQDRVEIADFDLDGDLDIFTTGDDGSLDAIFVLLNDGNGSFPAVQTDYLAGAVGFTDVGDLNGDSLPDIVYAAGGIRVLLNRAEPPATPEFWMLR